MRRLQESVRYCVEQVTLRDREQLTFAGAALARDVRVGYVTLRALNLEIAGIKDSVTNTDYGQLRFAWWKSTLAQILDQDQQLPDHPIAPALRSVATKHKLTPLWLFRILHAREKLFLDNNFAFKSVEALEQYSEQTASVMLYLSLQLNGVNDVAADHAASHIGKSSGLITSLRALPHVASSKGDVNLPRNLIEKHQVDPSRILKGEPSEALKSATYEIACQAKAHIDHARNLPNIPQEAIPVLLQAKLCDIWLDRLERCEFDIFDRRMLQPSNVAYLNLVLRWGKFREQF
eukprot:TRINITY_DN9676_c0_g1_i2.p2 TRINITY_DN9676_c0_g1~~TRINITY_DN9676_c0_g1_i2.p2  ORF type:complete len:291 (-),score=62.45 TRINITY_DN9676_c0_g1_i2:128-1000(-)